MNLYLITPALPEPPVATNWLGKMAMPCGAMLNTQIGNCTAAAKGHMIQVLTANAQAAEVTVADQSVLDMYVAVTGQEGAAYDPTTGLNDNGCTVIDSLDYMRQTGLEGYKIDAYLAFSPQSQLALRHAVSLFGCADTGLALPLGSMQQDVWDVPPHIPFHQQRFWRPGSWGGHDALIADYNEFGPVFISWGERVQASWAWWQAYGQEAYVPYCQFWINGPTGISPSQLDEKTLLADLQAVSQTP